MDVLAVALIFGFCLCCFMWFHVQEARRWDAERRKLTAALLVQVPERQAQVLTAEPRPTPSEATEPRPPRLPIS